VKQLSAYLYGKEAGRFTEESGKVTFRYRDEWLKAVEERQVHPLSISLPVNKQFSDDAPASYIAGLLPDSVKHREMLAIELGIDGDPSDFNFLSKLGRDCAGALTIIPSDEDVDIGQKASIDWLQEEALTQYIAALPRRPLLVDEEDGILLSLAGVNDKAAVVATKNKIGLPKHGMPSTHIIKTDIPGLKDSIRVEHFCLRLAEACGQEVPKSDVKVAGDQTFVLMRRYDRRTIAESTGPRLYRLHQEDFCQALGLRPAKKYERHGGPSWKDCFALMSVTSDPVRSREMLLDRAILQYLIGNPDAHGKNYSLLYSRTGEIKLAPFYDLNNAAAFRSNFKNTKQIMAMGIGGNVERDKLTTENWEQFAKDCSLSPALVMRRLEHLAATIAEKVVQLREEVQETAAETKLLDMVVEDISDRAGLWFDHVPALKI
jgi:serine/threonine-protein kinase HipA